MSPPRDRAAAVHSLPSFAQAFSSLPGNDDRALPPIQGPHRSAMPSREHSRHSGKEGSTTRSPPMLQQHSPPTGQRPAPPSSSRPYHGGGGPLLGKKRPRAPSMSVSAARNDRDDDGYENSDSDASPPPPPSSGRTIKSEHNDNYALSRSPSPPVRHPPRGKPPQSRNDFPLPNSGRDSHNVHISGGGAPPPSLSRPPSKRRRFTVSGGHMAHPLSNSLPLGLNTSNLSPSNSSPSLNAVGAGSTPISPVVMGFTIQQDDPAAIEQVRSMLNLKQKQKALIESRRGSLAGIAEGGSPPSGAVTMSKRGSIAGLDHNISRRGSLPALQLVPSVNIVNPPPGSSLASSYTQPPKRSSGPSPNGGGGQRQHGSAQAITPYSATGGRQAAAGGSGPTISGNVVRNPSSSPNLNTGARAANNSSRGSARANSPASQHVVPSQNPHHQQMYTLRDQTDANPHPQHSPPTMHVSHHQPPPPPPASSGSNPHTQQQQNSQDARAQVQMASQGLTALANALPPPPTSFASRRASQLGGRSNKPADIVVVSPKDAEITLRSSTMHKTPLQSHTSITQAQISQQINSTRSPMQVPAQPLIRSRNAYLALQPSIQSAPAVPRPGQAAGRFPAMALPSLPPTMGQSARGAPPPPTNERRVIPGQVPPTPTTLSMQRMQGTTETASVRLSQPSKSSLAVPGNGSHLLMPATPATAFHAVRQQQGATPTPSQSSGSVGGLAVGTFGRSVAEKQAFLAPFEQFYDALADARVLKSWFGEQLNRVGKVVREVETEKAEVERLKEELSVDAMRKVVAEAVAEASGAWKDEVMRLQARVSELENTLGRSNEVVEGDTDMGDEGRDAGRPSANGVFTLRPESPLERRGDNPPAGDASKNSGGGAGRAYPAAPGVDSYTFPPVPPAPSMAPNKSTTTGSSSGSSPPENRLQQRSDSPLLRMSLNANMGSGEQGGSKGDGGSGGGGGHTSRSISRSGASSPAPSMEQGRSMPVSVSAMRLEPPRSSNSKGNSKPKGNEGGDHPSLRRTNTMGSHGSTSRGRDTPSLLSGKRSRSPSAMDEN